MDCRFYRIVLAIVSILLLLAGCGRQMPKIAISSYGTTTTWHDSSYEVEVSGGESPSTADSSNPKSVGEDGISLDDLDNDFSVGPSTGDTASSTTSTRSASSGDATRDESTTNITTTSSTSTSVSLDFDNKDSYIRVPA